MNCILIDDDETSRLILSNLVSKIPELNLLSACSNTLEARDIINKKKVDIVLLDIEMPTENGFDFFESLTSEIPVVFITSQTKHAIKAFEKDAVDYLVKPINLERLRSAVTKVKRRTLANKLEEESKQSKEAIFIKSNEGLHKIYIEDLLYLESTNGFVSFFTTEKKIVMGTTLKQVLPKLNQDKFIRVHRNFIVNREKISKFDNENVYLQQVALPLSRLYKKEVLEKLKTQIW